MAAKITLIMVGIGKPSVGKELVEHLGIPNGEQFIFADPENALYDDLDLNRGVATTFFSPATPYAIRDRLWNGDTKEIGEVLQKWSKGELLVLLLFGCPRYCIKSCLRHYIKSTLC